MRRSEPWSAPAETGTTGAHWKAAPMTATATTCAADEYALRDGLAGSILACLPQQTVPVQPPFPSPAVLPEPADVSTPTPVTPSTPTPVTASTPTTTATTTATAVPVQPATATDIDTDVQPVLILALVVALIAAVVIAGAALVRRDDHARAARLVLRVGARRATWPLAAPWLLPSWCPAGLRLALALAALAVYGLTLIMLTGLLGLALPGLLLFGLLLLGGGHKLVGWRPAAEPEPEAWWSERKLLGALRAAGVLPRVKADAPPVVLRRYGQPRTDEHGTTVTFALPGALPWTDLLARRDKLAAVLGIPARQLVVTHNDDQPPNVVTLWVGVPTAQGSHASPLGTATTTTWRTPARIGRSPQGHPVTVQTHEANTLIAGLPGYGKTSAARGIVAHGLLDPGTRLWIVDGKASRDWTAAAPLAERFVVGTDDAVAEHAEELLGDVLAEVQRRNAAGTVDPPGLLVVLEEWTEVRAAADRAGRDRLDALLGRVLRTGRAAGCHVVLVSQRPTVEDVPGGARNLLSNRLCLTVRNAADAALVLGEQPTLALPTRRGEALLAVPTGTVSVVLDHLDATGWEAVCRRAAAMRPDRPPATVAPATAPHSTASVAPEPEPESDVPEAPVPVRDPLVHAVVEVLRDSDPRGLPATSLLGMLPGWLAPPSPAHLGRALGKAPELERGHVGKAPVWRLASLGVPSVHPRCNPRTEGAEGSGATKAQVSRTPGAAPSVPSVSTAGSAE